MKLRTKVFITFIALSVVPLFFITFIAYHRYVITTNQRIENVTSNMFENTKTELNNTITTIKQTAGLFTFYADGDFSIIENLRDFSSPSDTHSSYDAFRANQNIKFVCQNVLYSYDYIYGLYVFTPSGVILGHDNSLNGSIPADYQPEDEAWYQETLAQSGSLYVSSIADHEMFSGKKESIFFAQSLHDVYTHQFLGVLVIDCAPALFDISASNTYPEAICLTLRDTSSGSVLCTSGYSSSHDAADETYTYETRLDLPSLQLTAEIDDATLFRDYNFTGLVLISACLISVIGILILSFLISRSLAYPVEHLSRKMAAQNGHHLTTSSKYLNRTDEIGTLYNEYNNMIEELNTSIKKDYQDKLIALDAQMKSLEARINSHFLFNTLESINSMAEIADNEDISIMSLALGNMFRYSIKTPSELVTIADELRHVNDYFSIQQIRFDNKFRIEIQIPDHMYRLKILKLILQPLVENALYHGLNYCTVGDTIRITGRTEHGMIVLSVSDNGQGMPPETLEKLNRNLLEEARFTDLGRRNKSSIGLTNIHSRIELYYGKGYGLSVKSEEHRGTMVEIKVPVLELEDK